MTDEDYKDDDFHDDHESGFGFLILVLVFLGFVALYVGKM
jgi:hypothetical protein